MELSLFSRDVIALSTAVGSATMYDAAALLGICDKIVPGLLIGALRFGYLPVLLVPGGPMPTGLPNKEKQRLRELDAEGKLDTAELLERRNCELPCARCVHLPRHANTNQMILELMGVTSRGPPTSIPAPRFARR